MVGARGKKAWSWSTRYKSENFYPISKEVILKVLKSDMTYLFSEWALTWEKKKKHLPETGRWSCCYINVSQGWKAERRSLPALTTVFSKSFPSRFCPIPVRKTMLHILVCCSIAKSCLDSLVTHVLHHARLPCPSLSPEVCPNSCPLSRWCHPSISSSVASFTCPQSFPASVFSNELALCIRWPKYWSFGVSPSNEYSGLISFRIDWFMF